MFTKKFGAIEAVLWVAIGAGICVLAWKAHLGSFQEPGPGFLAFIAGLFLSVVGILMFFSQAASRAHADGQEGDRLLTFHGAPWGRLVFTIAILFAYGLFLDILGFVLTTFLLMWALLYDRERNNYLLSFLAAVLIVGISYLVFNVWLQTQLPRGLLPWW